MGMFTHHRWEHKIIPDTVEDGTDILQKTQMTGWFNGYRDGLLGRRA